MGPQDREPQLEGTLTMGIFSRPAPRPRRTPPARSITPPRIDRNLFAAILAHARALPVELGGLLLGVEEDGVPAYTMAAFPPNVQQTPTFCSFSDRHQCALELALHRLGMFRVLPRADWVHTHPGLGVFFSGTDMATFEALRRERPGIQAIVIDPNSRDTGVFDVPGGVPAELVPGRALPNEEREEAELAAHLALAASGVEVIFHGGPVPATRQRRAATMAWHAELTLERLDGEMASRLSGLRERVEALEARLEVAEEGTRRRGIRERVDALGTRIEETSQSPGRTGPADLPADGDTASSARCDGRVRPACQEAAPAAYATAEGERSQAPVPDDAGASAPTQE